MNINEHDRKEIKGCMEMKEELIQNNDSICIKRTIPLFSEEEIKNIDENFISIVNGYSKMLVKEKEQKTIQLLLKKQNEEIERLNNIINKLEKWLNYSIESINEKLDNARDKSGIIYSMNDYQILRLKTFRTKMNEVLNKLKELKENKYV